MTTMSSDGVIGLRVHVDVHEEDTTVPRKRVEFVGERRGFVGEAAPSTEVVEELAVRGIDLCDDARETLRAVVPALVVVGDGDDDLALGEVAFVRKDEVQQVEGGCVGDLENDFIEFASETLRRDDSSGGLSFSVVFLSEKGEGAVDSNREVQVEITLIIRRVVSLSLFVENSEAFQGMASEIDEVTSIDINRSRQDRLLN